MTLDKVTADYSAAIGAVLPKIARAILAATGATNFNVLQVRHSIEHLQLADGLCIDSASPPPPLLLSHQLAPLTMPSRPCPRA